MSSSTESGLLRIAGWTLLALLVSPQSWSQPLHWYRGNTHTHTLNSDGDASPDVVVRWYREHGYQFVVVTDHEFLTDVAPLQALFGVEEKFLVMKGQEVTQLVADPTHPDGHRQAHVNAINTSRLVMPMSEGKGVGHIAPQGTTIAQTFARNLSEIRAAGGIGQINHPNFRWSVGVADMAQLPDGTLFEIWNGVRESNNLGGSDGSGHVALSTEALWDTLLSRGKRIWAVASDDSHYFRGLVEESSLALPGQSWIVVRAERLAPETIVAALQKGNFYASNGITLEDYAVNASNISITIKQTTRRYGPPPVTRFLTRFIGKDGRLLAEVPGLKPRYTIRGDEGYVRVSIIDSNGHRAWTQPIFLEASSDLGP